jgi:hypothetical protein
VVTWITLLDQMVLEDFGPERLYSQSCGVWLTCT